MSLIWRAPRLRIASDRVSSLTRPICVIGMGRSGTSLTTALIGILGINLGPEERMLQPVEHDNARGYWEQREICEINEEVLGAFGGTWERPPNLPLHWERSAALDDVRDRATAFLKNVFDGSTERWGWKDPRAAVTLPFWQGLIGDMDYILCVRNPADVAVSLAARGTHDLDFTGSIALWCRYTQAALANTRGSRRLILGYENYFLEPDHQIRRLTEFVCGPDVHPSSELYERLEHFVEPGLWHNRDPGDGMDRVRATSPRAAELYTRIATSEANGDALRESTRYDRSLLAGLPIAQVWWVALILNSIIAVTDAIDHSILIPLLVVGPLCSVLTGRWIRAATVGVWTVALSVLLCLPDGIWGTSAQLAYLGAVVIVAVLSTSAAMFIEGHRVT